MKWKIIAIIFMVLFILENLLFTWAYIELEKEEERTNVCYYDICSGYEDALYEDDVCTCYERDMIGNYMIGKEKYMR